MFVGKLLAATVAAGLTLSFAPPAGAGEGLGVATQVAGTVVALTEKAVDDVKAFSVEIEECMAAVWPAPPDIPNDASEVGVPDVPSTDLPAECDGLLQTSVRDDDRVGTPELIGKCTYVGVTTVNGRIIFTFTGAVVSYSTDPTRQPQATQAVCRLESPTQSGVPGSEPTYNQTTSIALAGAVAPTPPAQTTPLQLRPVNICVSGFGVYGPNTEGNPKLLPEECTTNAL